MVDIPFSKLTAASALSGEEITMISQLSASVTISAATISAQASDNSFNDSGDGFAAAGFAVDDYVYVTGFTGDVANNIFSAKITALTAGKMTIGGSDGDVIVDDAAGESVTISKWVSRRATARAVSGSAGAIVTKSSQTMSNSDFSTSISFDTEVRDESAFWDGGSPTKLVAPSDGWYLVSASQTWASNTTGNRWLRIRTFSAADALMETLENTYQPGTGAQSAEITGVFYFTAGQYATMQPAQTSGGNLASTSNRLAMVKIG